MIGSEKYPERKMPERFDTEADDRLMNSLIKTYAIEGQKDGKPDGHFYLNRSGMEAVSKEVAQTHLKLTGEKNVAYVNERLGELWGKYDVNGTGHIEVARGAVLLRELVGNVHDGFGLQMQITK